MYLATGDNFNPNNAQNLTSVKGKVIRLNLDGSIPNTNPYKGNTLGYRPEIYAIGLRNPFKGAFDKSTNRFIIGNVGGNVTTSKEQIEVLIPGGSQVVPGNVVVNFGWPNCGDFGTNTDGTCTDPNYTDPVFSYPLTGGHGTRAVIGGVVYRGTYPAVSTNQFPSSFEGKYFYADYNAGGLYYLTFDSNNGLKVDSNSVFLSPATVGIRTIIQGPDGSLYYYKADLGNSFAGELHQLIYNSGNRAPAVTATASVTSGTAPLSVNFSATGTDADQDPLTYLWDFGDNTSSISSNVTHAYTSNGRYIARVRVSDGVVASYSTPIVIQVGQAPVLTISSQGNSPFHIGQILHFTANATDDGPLSQSSYASSIVLQHGLPGTPGSHQHPITSATGNTLDYIVQSDHSFDGDISLVVTFTVTDSDGLITQQSIAVQPDMANITFNTNPAGLNIVLDGVTQVTPFTLHEIKGHVYTVQAAGQCLNGAQ